ncbi:MAG: hypothetical protein IJF84_10895 [Thermoguttaceae bacterium]|nr:hypothetical protein [Thermoguttaceae bacterium]
MFPSQPAEFDASDKIVCTRLDNFKIRAVADFWNSCQYPRNRRKPIDIDMLERQVFSKNYFDPNGFIIAWRGDKIVGLAHAGFGYSDDCDSIDYSWGIIPLICYNGGADADDVLDALLISSERYLISKGAKRIQIGTHYPHAPFYLGLIHSSDLPGVFLEESSLIAAAKRHGYESNSYISHFRRNLENIDWVDQAFMDKRQRYSIQMEYCPTPSQWGRAIAMNGIIWSQLSLIEIGQGIVNSKNPAAKCALWVIDDLPDNDMIIVGLSQCFVRPEYRGQHLSFFLLTEAMRRLTDQQVARIEIQVPDEWQSFIRLLSDNQFDLFAHSALFSKEIEVN